MKIKLKFNTSATTTLDPHDIIARARLAIIDKKYNLEAVTGKSISFKDSPFNFQANLSIRMMDEGEFVLNGEPGGKQLLTLNYRYNLLPIILISILLSIWLFYKNETWGIAAVLAFYAIAIPFDIRSAKRKAKDMVMTVADS